jgi:hypothetical protein
MSSLLISNYKPNLLVKICLVDAKNLDFSKSIAGFKLILDTAGTETPKTTVFTDTAGKL